VTEVGMNSCLLLDVMGRMKGEMEREWFVVCL